MQCAILAGGLGERLLPVTETIPKALVPVAGEPFAHHQLRLLAAEGVRDVVYCIGYHGAKIREAIGDGRRFGVDVVYVDEGPALRGTAGALRLALDEGALDETFAVLYGDSYLPIELAPVWRAFAEAGLPALMTVLHNEDRWDRSNARFEGGRVTLYEKGGTGAEFIDYGLSVLDRRIVAERIPAAAVADLSTLYHELSVEGSLAGYEVHERFYEVGSPTGLAELERYLTSAARTPPA
jgi:NDP-sugar pyrophosphorylase family protein